MRSYAELETALQLDLENVDVMLTSDMTIDAACRQWLRRSFWKKFQDEKAPDADEKCLELFVTANSRCRTFNLEANTTQEEQVIGEVKSLIESCFFSGPDHNYTFSDFLEGGITGPGASVDVACYNFYTKLFDSSLSSTSSELYGLYRQAIRSNPTWISAEMQRYHNYGACRVVPGNRLSYVPKTKEISRSICTEPVLNMFVQKGVGAVLENVLVRKFGINLSHQPELNRRLAQTGSISGGYSTIDLSSASDSVSLKLLGEILPPEILRWLVLSRSPLTELPNGEQLELHMVSSMGNAFTFPLQTLIFSSLVVACYRVLGIKPRRNKDGPTNWAVFGDDIIIKTDAYHFVARCLEMFGFLVNTEKSFAAGYFRESCGGDYLRGHDIRGVYVKSLKGAANIYSTINRLTRWSVRTGVLLPRVIELLLSWVKYRPIPWQAGDSEGVKCAYPPAYLHRKKDNCQGCILYTYLAEVPTRFKVPIDVDGKWEDPIHWEYPSREEGKRGKTALYNPTGLLVAFVGGFIEDGCFHLRSEVKKTFQVRRRFTSSWSSTVVAGDGNLQGDDWKIVSELYALTR